MERLTRSSEHGRCSKFNYITLDEMLFSNIPRSDCILETLPTTSNRFTISKVSFFCF